MVVYNAHTYGVATFGVKPSTIMLFEAESSSRCLSLGEMSPSFFDLPQRSRNAVAQARYRAKRKAYVQQLEKTIAILKFEMSTVSLANSEGARRQRHAEARIMELERENASLRCMIHCLRQKIETCPNSGNSGLVPKREFTNDLEDRPTGTYSASSRINWDLRKADAAPQQDDVPPTVPSMLFGPISKIASCGMADESAYVTQFDPLDHSHAKPR